MNRSLATVVAETPARFDAEEVMLLAPALQEFPGKTELVDGVIVRRSPASYLHFAVQRQLFCKLAVGLGKRTVR